MNQNQHNKKESRCLTNETENIVNVVTRSV